MKTFFMLTVGIAAAVYLENPTLGVVELFPDNLPFIGNLDEGLATLLLINSLAYFGLDLRRSYSKPPGTASEVPPKQQIKSQ